MTGPTAHASAARPVASRLGQWLAGLRQAMASKLTQHERRCCHMNAAPPQDVTEWREEFRRILPGEHCRDCPAVRRRF